jgi:hypothetical protein
LCEIHDVIETSAKPLFRGSNPILATIAKHILIGERTIAGLEKARKQGASADGRG